MTNATNTNEDPHFAAFPTYPLIMGFKGTEFELVNFYEKASAKFPPGLPKIGSNFLSSYTR
jgi:hypothetical protein